MGNHQISRDVKIAAIKLYEQDLLSLDNILDCCGFSERTFYRILKLWRETGDVVHPSRIWRGRIRKLDYNDVQYLLFLIQENPDYFLDELLHLLKTNRFISVHYATVDRELKWHGVSLKKLKRVAKERSEERRADFTRRMAQYNPEEIGFIDETSKDERTICRRYGRSRKGTRAAKQQVFIQGRRTTITGLLSMDGLVAGTVVEGSMTKATFMEFLEFTVVCTVVFCFVLWILINVIIVQLPKSG
jgi:transposase